MMHTKDHWPWQIATTPSKSTVSAHLLTPYKNKTNRKDHPNIKDKKGTFRNSEKYTNCFLLVENLFLQLATWFSSGFSCTFQLQTTITCNANRWITHWRELYGCFHLFKLVFNQKLSPWISCIQNRIPVDVALQFT